ncbi:MAG: hypothetical protein K0S11_1121 [Gammaproteobacteria bacterium]|jgi:hypothetical protein|nr:hypothetical protein [Gammaproteobacteria bacterium]
MNKISILFLSAAAPLGLTLLLYVLKNKNTPKALVFSHGLLATLGLLALVIYALVRNTQLLTPALLLLLAAVGGFMLAWRDLLGLSVPKWLAAGHGIIALIGVALLLG